MTGDNLDVSKWIQYALADYNAAVNIFQLHRPVDIKGTENGFSDIILTGCLC